MGLLATLWRQRTEAATPERPRSPGRAKAQERPAPIFVLSEDPAQARHEMFGLIFYLTTFGYIDGEFDPNETAYIHQTIDTVTERWLEAASEGEPEGLDERVAQDRAFFHELFAAVREEVTRLLHDSVLQAEAMHLYLGCKLKQRCFEIFKEFAPDKQEQLLAAADGLLKADGVLHPAELSLRRELAELLGAEHSPPPLQPEQVVAPPRVRLDEEARRRHEPLAPPFFEPFEHPFSTDPKELRQQVLEERRLIKRGLAAIERLRKQGRNRLRRVERVDQLPPGSRFLDDFVHVQVPEAQRRYELTVIGDLHGCYSCLKAALIQSRFFARLVAFRKQPEREPEPKLVFLGDYIDRGRFSLDGVVRLVLELQSTWPEHVFMLRGNHEHLIEDDGEIRSVVAGADAFADLRDRAPLALLRDYRRLFDNTPSALLFGRLLFTHAGIPGDGLLRSGWRGLSNLNDPAVRFQMMWSDPSLVDVIPRALQEQSVRFGFGRLQCQAFLNLIGCNGLIRGHGLVSTGFRADAKDDVLIGTLCSAGGAQNLDLPEVHELRQVRPTALTIHLEGGLDGELVVEAWPLDYEPYNSPERNGFYR